MRLRVSGEGFLEGPHGRMRCALGRSGIRPDKREGDGATPSGCFPLRYVLYRPDRVAAPTTRLPVRVIGPDDGWCDDPGDPLYNRPVKLPYPGHSESLWRQDGCYDVVMVIGHNDQPVVPGHGSAIFLHVAKPGYLPTAGCVALSLEDVLAVLEWCDDTCDLWIEGEREGLSLPRA